jgi:hypothetical protein
MFKVLCPSRHQVFLLVLDAIVFGEGGINYGNIMEKLRPGYKSLRKNMSA